MERERKDKKRIHRFKEQIYKYMYMLCRVKLCTFDNTVNGDFKMPSFRRD